MHQPATLYTQHAPVVRASRSLLQRRNTVANIPRSKHAAKTRPTCKPRCDQAQTSPLVVDGVKYDLCEAGERLKFWILENGGVVHPSLVVVNNAPSGSRGVICTEAVGVDEIDRSPLLLVPEFLYMTSQVARVGFEYYEGQGASPLGELDLATQLATLLAHERAQ
eukprot:4991577-Pyramimonas_sp.AAC.1